MEAFSFCPAVPPLSTEQPRRLGAAAAPVAAVSLGIPLTIHLAARQFGQARIPFRMLILPDNQRLSDPGLQAG